MAVPPEPRLRDLEPEGGADIGRHDRRAAGVGQDRHAIPLRQRLLREGVSIRSLATILETIGDYASLRREPWFLVERARERLARSLSGALRDRQRTLYALALAPELERQLIERIELAF